MITQFKLELDKTSGLTIPAYEAEEMYLWLNSGAMKFVKTRYSGLNSKKQGFEQTQKRTDDLRTLVREKSITGANLIASTAKPNAYVADLTSLTATLADIYLFALEEEVTITYTTTSADDILATSAGSRQGVTEVTANDYRAHIDDPYSEHILHYEKAKPLRLFLGDTVELITDGNYVISEYHIRYIAHPQIISSIISCDLPEHTHEEIVKIAANMALENIEQPRYQSHANEVNTME